MSLPCKKEMEWMAFKFEFSLQIYIEDHKWEVGYEKILAFEEIDFLGNIIIITLNERFLQYFKKMFPKY